MFKGDLIIHSESIPVYREVGESRGRKITAHLSRLHKAAEWSQQQRDTRSRAAELKYTALGNELSKFRVHIARNYTKAQGFWAALAMQKKRGLFHGSFCSTGRRFSLSSGAAVGPAWGKWVWASASDGESNNSFVSAVTSSHIPA